MPDEETTAAPEEGQADDISLEEAYATTLAEQGEESGEEQQPAEAAPEEPSEEQAEEGEPSPEEPSEPEHLTWLKSVGGNYDPDADQFHIDRVAKQAFELNKQNQDVVRQNQQLQQLFSIPEVAQAVLAVQARMRGEQPPPTQTSPEEKPDSEKTEKELLDEYIQEGVKEYIDKHVAPALQQSGFAYQQVVAQNVLHTISAVESEMGEDHNGQPLFAPAREGKEPSPLFVKVFQRIAQVADQVKQPVDQLIVALATNGQLQQTLVETANAILAPELRSQVTRQAAARQATQEKKRAVLSSPKAPVRGTPSEKEPESIQEAAEQAMRELKMA